MESSVPICSAWRKEKVEENKCLLLGVVGNPEGMEDSGVCRVLCMTLWDREEDLTQGTAIA